MKNINDFVTNNSVRFQTFKTLCNHYDNLTDKIKRLLKEKKKYDDLINTISNDDNEKFSFQEQLAIYNIINETISKISNNQKDYTHLDINLIQLRDKLLCKFPELSKYLIINDELTAFKELRNRILLDSITFHIFSEDYFDERCIDKHYFVRLDNELKCICCGATTKDYPFNKRELDFLTLCAEKQGMLIKEATKDDLSLLEVLIDEIDDYKTKRKTLDPDNEDYFAQAEEYYLEDAYEIANLTTQIRKAHLLDSKELNDDTTKMINQKYLSDTKTQTLLLEIEKDLKKLQSANSRFKKLMIEECKTIKYEILILSGFHIPTLFEETKDEEDKIALTKAYYNLSNQKFRINSEYFDQSNKNWDALTYDCITAHPEINNRLLKMKLKK